MKLGSRAIRTLLALAVLPAVPAAAADLALGASIPKADVKMKSVDGRKLSIADVKGEKGTLVIFTCNHCPWVIAWEERVVALGNEFSGRGVGVIAINPNDPAVQKEDGLEAMQARAAERGKQFPYVVDATSDVARAFHAKVTPEAFLFDAEGRLVYHGTIDDNAQKPAEVKRTYLRDALEALVSGGEIEDKQTKALGCTIKFRAASSS
jgi:peroxiredoxin